MFDSIKQLKNLRDQAKQMQDQLAQEQVTGSGAKGKVRITMDGNQEITEVVVDPSLLNPEQQQIVEKAIQDALEDARNQIKSLMASKLQSGGLPGM